MFLQSEPRLRASSPALFHLPLVAGRPHAVGMFLVSDLEADTIRAAYEHSGEFTAMLELRRMFPGLTVDQARDCVRTIAGWKPLAPPPGKPRTCRPRTRS
jgi:hypothetical protein